MKNLVVYTYAKCSTCRKATKWLTQQGLDFSEKPIRETPPTRAELKQMLGHQNGELKKLFNTSGGDYRELKLGPKLPAMSPDDALALLSENGNLVKRPFLLAPGVGLVGFKEDVWQAALV
ncbi:arsenate reductase family protein [Synoicihabitans lomoniglobus]|uniref:Arsenate reductase family protein n=1 Tax=Synoicihabitans lomoniglobus TaxID=2909285 RepID=A0AAF0CQX6_9BACT|nr:arsenate reductase family protein [Opitutaceae bacterium LMO-M01]WED66394.1 arsenate reductase family protein [Opitutaceae bacterium LMO-M01]